MNKPYLKRYYASESDDIELFLLKKIVRDLLEREIGQRRQSVAE